MSSAITFVVKGTRIRLKMLRGKLLTLSPRIVMMHDTAGKHWPECSLLLGPTSKGRAAKPEEYEGAPKGYLGRNHKPRVDYVNTPPRALSEWKLVGEVERIDYVRPGTKAPGGYKHTFNAPRGMMHLVFLIKGKGAAVLRKHKSFYRLDLPRGCILDERGIVWS